MSLSRDDVLRVAALARLDLDEDSIEPLLHDLDQIIGYVQKLDEVDTSNVPPTAQVAVQAAAFRPDVVTAGTPTDLALREAPRATPEGFCVPAFVDET